MAKLEVKKSGDGLKFWMLDAGNKQTLFDDAKEAIEAYKPIMKKEKDKKSEEKTRLLTVSIAGEKIGATSMSWEEIAMQLLGE